MSARDATVAMLRALAGLLEAREDAPVPSVRATFWVREQGGADTAAAIVSALPGDRKHAFRHYGERDYLEITITAGGAVVDVDVLATEAGTPTGTRTVTEYEPIPEIKALLGEPEAGQ